MPSTGSAPVSSSRTRSSRRLEQPHALGARTVRLAVGPQLRSLLRTLQPVPLGRWTVFLVRGHTPGDRDGQTSMDDQRCGCSGASTGWMTGRPRPRRRGHHGRLRYHLRHLLTEHACNTVSNGLRYVYAKQVNPIIRSRYYRGCYKSYSIK